MKSLTVIGQTSPTYIPLPASVSSTSSSSSSDSAPSPPPKSRKRSAEASHDSTPSCSSNSTALVSTDEAAGLRRECPICGDVSHNKHFGVASCNACAAFFRRTIAHQRRYTCVRGKQCHISYGNARHMCKFCRFQRCILEGMNIGAVFVRSTDEYRSFDADSPLRQILLSQRATFVNRYTSQLKSYGGDHSLVRMGAENPSFPSTVVCIASEYTVLTEYLVASGFRDMGATTANINELARALFYPWLCYHSIMAALRNGGHKTNIAYFVDESHVQVSDEHILKYVNGMDGIMDSRVAAKATKDFFSKALETAAQIHVARMEEPEHAAMFHIFALKAASRLFSDNKQYSDTINEIFAHLRRHYDKNYDDTALRMGNMILLITMLETIGDVFAEYVTILHLNGYDTVLSKIKSKNTDSLATR